MGWLKGFMILGAICFMIISFAEQMNEKCFIRDICGMLVCSLIALVIHLCC